MVRRVKFRIDESGEVSVDVEGAVGSKCDELTQDFEAGLGETTDKKRKDAFYVQDADVHSESEIDLQGGF